MLIVALLGLLPALASTARAQPTGPHIVYLPWVSNGEAIGDQGPWYSVLSFQNLSDDACTLQVFQASDGLWQNLGQLSMLERESRSTPAGTLGIATPGAPLRFQSTCEIAVTVKQYTPNLVRPPWADGAQVVTGYTALGEPDVAAASATQSSAWFLPIVQTNSDWNTFIRVANLSETTDADVTIEIYPSGNSEGADGVILTLSQLVGVAETRTIDLLAALGGSGFVGFARITANEDIGVVARRVKPSAAMAITNVAIAADAGGAEGNYRTAASLLFNAYNGWNTGITMANGTDQVAVVTLQYYPAGGAMLRQESIVIAARSMHYIYTPGNVEQAGFVGGATILSNVPIVAAVDEVKYETGEALSYMVSGVSQHMAAIPIVFHEDAPSDRNDNSGISIVNLDPLNQQTVLLRIWARNGTELLDLPIAVQMPPAGNNFVYIPFVDEVAPGTIGAVTLESESAAGFVAISNNINYAVEGDGSVVFSASGNGGVYFVPVPAP